ncbi:MAG: hypothetical protein MHMPM18_003985 [Marteilia pararefringens]
MRRASKIIRVSLPKPRAIAAPSDFGTMPGPKVETIADSIDCRVIRSLGSGPGGQNANKMHNCFTVVPRDDRVLQELGIRRKDELIVKSEIWTTGILLHIGHQVPRTLICYFLKISTVLCIILRTVCNNDFFGIVFSKSSSPRTKIVLDSIHNYLYFYFAHPQIKIAFKNEKFGLFISFARTYKKSAVQKFTDEIY